MTREDAIKVLNMVEAHGLAEEAKKMAIKALSQEEQSEWERDHEILKAYADGQESMKPCKDAVSRHAVDKLIDELARAISDERCFIPRGRSTATIMQDVLDLPSVSTEKTGRWIPVTERLPKRYELVLVTDKFGFVDTAHFIHDDLMEKDEWKVADDETIDVIAWMPLPQPYKAESEG